MTQNMPTIEQQKAELSHRRDIGGTGEQGMSEMRRSRFDQILDGIDKFLKLSMYVSMSGLVLMLLLIGLWPLPFPMRPDSPPLSQQVVRVIGFGGALVMALILRLCVWLERRKER